MLEQDRITKKSVKTSQVALNPSKPACAEKTIEQELKALGHFESHISDESIHFKEEDLVGLANSIYTRLIAALSETIYYKKPTVNANDDIEKVEYFNNTSEQVLLYTKSFTYDDDLDVDTITLREEASGLEVTKTFIYNNDKDNVGSVFS